MLKLFISDIIRLHTYFGNSGVKSWVKLFFLRSVWAVFFIRMRGMQVPIFRILLRPFASVFLSNLFKIELAGQCSIGPGLMLPHPNDLIIGACEIGANATFMNSITLGAKYSDPTFSPNKRPRVGNNVTLGVGARVLGSICLGDHSIVGANSVVVRSVPKGQVVGGIPAKLLRLKRK
jgi:serine O-acetyltransferase